VERHLYLVEDSADSEHPRDSVTGASAVALDLSSSSTQKKGAFVALWKDSDSPIEIDAAVSHPAYATRLSMYKIPPTDSITLPEFERFACDRMKVLRQIETLRNRGLKGKKFREALRDYLAKYLPLRNAEDIRKDVISHFILRLAHCRPKDRAFFLTQERFLLETRILLTERGLDQFIADNDLKFTKISEKEFDALRKELTDQLASYLDLAELDSTSITQADFFVVPFEDVLDLVATRRVYLRAGTAYVHRRELLTLVLNEFRTHLSRELDRAYKMFPLFANDEQVGPLLLSLPQQYLGKDYSFADTSHRGNKININELDNLSKRSYPLCMRNLHERLREQHHLRHFGRMQYGLFLKGIGVTLEDALEFWRSEFAQKVGTQVFEKQYAYNIRHNYGQEGRRQDYTPYSCQKIIEMSVQPGEAHGCPFRHWQTQELSARLTKYGFESYQINEILTLVKSHKYQEACKKYFEYTHPGCVDYNQVHPNQYFRLSMKYHELGPERMKAAYLKAKQLQADHATASLANTNNSTNNTKTNTNNAAEEFELTDAELLEL
jgi:DNA primase large subunit